MQEELVNLSFNWPPTDGLGNCVGSTKQVLTAIHIAEGNRFLDEGLCDRWRRIINKYILKSLGKTRGSIAELFDDSVLNKDD